jgi:hypothetical protein
MLTYWRSDILDVIGYLDSNFASCSNDRKSTSGYVFMMAGEVVSSKSVKYDTYSFLNYRGIIHSLLPGYMLGYTAAKFFSGLVVVDTIEKPLKIFCDNSAILSLKTLETLRDPNILI